MGVETITSEDSSEAATVGVDAGRRATSAVEGGPDGLEATSLSTSESVGSPIWVCMVVESEKVHNPDAELVADSVTWVNVESGKNEGLSTA